MNPTRLKVILTALGGLLLSVIIFLTGPEPIEANIPDKQPTVSVTELEKSSMPLSISAYGTLNPRQSLQLTTRVPGEIIWVSDKLVAGGDVNAGEELFRIDPSDYEIAVASANAKHAQSEARVDLEKGHSENAKLEWSKWQAISGEKDKASALALREPQQAEVLAVRAINKAELDKAKLALQRTSVRTPWDASVIDATAVEGQVVATGDVTATLYPKDFAVVELQVPLQTLGMLKKGVHAVELRPVGDPEVKPVLGEFQGVVQSLTEDTRLATLRITINDPLANPGWVYGMHLAARIVSQDRVITAQIPAGLIVSGNLIWLYRNGQAVRHQIAPIQSDDRQVMVEDNFLPGDQIILERPIGLFDGAEVLALRGQGNE